MSIVANKRKARKPQSNLENDFERMMIDIETNASTCWDKEALFHGAWTALLWVVAENKISYGDREKMLNAIERKRKSIATKRRATKRRANKKK